MKLPEGAIEREQFYSEVVSACFASLEKRKETYAYLMHFFTYGCAPEEGETAYNKIFPILDTLTAFLYSADSTRFSAHIGPEVPKNEWDKAAPISKAVNSEWINSGADMKFSEGLTLSLVYGSSFLKTLVKDGHMVPHVVEPHCLGVYREDVNGMDRQEAIVHSYYITKSQLENELDQHPNKTAILKRITERPKTQEDDMPNGLRRIIVTNAAGVPPLTPGGTARGNGAGAIGFSAQVDYVPNVAQGLVEMCELWVWSDKAGDWQTVTMADGRVCVYDRPNIFVPGQHPFTQICPNPRHGYFWGEPEVARLTGLQGWRNLRVAEIKDLLAKQVTPPTSLEGWTGAVDEVDFALNKAGGVLVSSEPMAKVNRFKPDISADIWNDVREIDEMFSEAAALPNILMGRGETGVRSGRQTSELSRLGSARIKKRALVVEDSLDSLSTKMYKAMRRYDADHYETEPTELGAKPVKFILKQAPDDLMIRVDAHSNSPLFVEDQKALAGEMIEVHAIDRESYIEMLNPPMKDVLLRRLKANEAKEIAAAKAKAQHEEQIEREKHSPPGLAGALKQVK